MDHLVLTGGLLLLLLQLLFVVLVCDRILVLLLLHIVVLLRQVGAVLKHGRHLTLPARVRVDARLFCRAVRLHGLHILQQV